MPFRREGTKEYIKVLLLVVSVKIHHVSSFAFLHSDSHKAIQRNILFFFFGGDTPIEVKRTSFLSQNKTIDEN